ncbi:hypothetical protein PSI19_12910 [Xenorhabdus khoisanae]|uniref:hypothetical protein n=1 Tax=Xenorhabdus khoisanae TaxID=880157 RepID=UPI0023598A6F|nr:hypothetical protein [Xenorhabdus khoisanae]MDC9614746.1 hypothetical protein [Xenorhabdus khoisanae]
MIFRLCFLRAAQSLPLVAVVIAKQFPHFQLNFTELVLLPNDESVVTVGEQHQTAVHDFDGQCAANIKACFLLSESATCYYYHSTPPSSTAEWLISVVTFSTPGQIQLSTKPENKIKQ